MSDAAAELLAAALHVLDVSEPRTSAEHTGLARLREACRVHARETRTRRIYVTQHAVDCYCRVRGWDVNNSQQWSSAEKELLDMAIDARRVRVDRFARELWKSPNHTGRGLRWVVDPRPHAGGQLPRAIWVGQARAPAQYFEHPGELIENT